MKKAKFLIAAAFILAIGSAFVPKAINSKALVYRNVTGCPQDIECDGGSNTCGYQAGCSTPVGKTT